VESRASAEISKRLSNYKLFQESCFLEIEELSEAITRVFERGNKLLICGNGGSAADSQHLAAEFVSSFSFGLERRSLPAIALTVDSSIITAISNDFNFDLIFSRQIQGLGVPGDALLILSTSGESANCIRAAEEARKKEMVVLSLTRRDSRLYRMADVAVGVPLIDTQHIQECHLISYHIIAENIDFAFKKEG